MAKHRRVLGIDLASKRWMDIGSALVEFDQDRFLHAAPGAVSWPKTKLSPSAVASAVDAFVRSEAIHAVSIDGPQGWRDPEAPKDRPGVGRACEYEARTPGKTGTCGVAYPRTYLAWIQFSVDVFSELLCRPGVELVNDPAGIPNPSSAAYWLLESFPTSTWRTSGLKPLPAKRKSSAEITKQFARRLVAAYSLPSRVVTGNHDDLQAVVAALPAVGLVGGPSTIFARGEPAVRRTGVQVEGIIWDAGTIEGTTLIVAPRTSLRLPRIPLAARQVSGRGDLKNFDHAAERTAAGDALKKLTDAVEGTRLALKPYSELGKALQADVGIRNFLVGVNPSPELFRATLGPVDDLRRSGIFDAASRIALEFHRILSPPPEGRLQRLAPELARVVAALRSDHVRAAAKDLARFQQAAADFESRFVLPNAAELTALLRSSEMAGLARVLSRYRIEVSALNRAFGSMSVPWLDTYDKLRSLSGFGGLQGIGRLVSKRPAFESRTSEQLRLCLGDWRDRIDWSTSIFSNPVARIDFYRERGFDPALADFPAAAFDQGVTIAGLKRPPPPSIAEYYTQLIDGQGDEEAGFSRTNAAHDRLQRFETHVRRFIEEKMRAAFGEAWIRQQVPGEIWQDWRHKRQAAYDRGEPEHPLIAYADFTHYVPIITRKDNWERAFKSIFRRRALVQESFQRLYPIRLCTMHARIITQADELYLYAESKRLLTAMGIAM